MTEHDPTSSPESALDDEIEIEIELRSPAEVATRLILVASLCRRAFIEHDLAAGADPDSAGERFDLAAWTEAEGLVPFATVEERRLLNAPPATWTADQIAAQSWQGEGLIVLGWCLGLIETLPAAAAIADPAPLLALIPEPWDSTKTLRTTARLRDEETIAVARERAELWHWRAETASLAHSASAADQRDITLAIHDVATEARRANLLERTVADDFPIGDRPYASLAPEALADLAIASFERGRAFDWTCGLLESWDAPTAEDEDAP